MPASNRARDESQQPLLSNRQGSNPPPSQQQYGTASRPQLNSSFTDNQYLLKDVLYPKDAWEGTQYWADLPSDVQAKWTNVQYRSEASKEFGQVWQMFKRNPISPFIAYMRTYAIAGVGFFAEGNVLFSVGNIMPLLKAVWPQCWENHVICNAQVIEAIKYMEIAGIIFGQMTVGYIGDTIGRRWGLIQDAAIMLLGTILLTSMWGATLSGWTIMYGVSLFVFSFGVGGEYPMTSTTSMEKYHDREDRLHRGRNVLLAFLMQGWGQLFNQISLIIVLYMFNKSLQKPYGEFQTQFTFRLGFALATLFLAYFLYLRIYKVKGVDQGQKSKSYDGATLKLVIRHYWGRVLATSVCWFCSDFPFYGNQVFRNQLLSLVTGAAPDEVSILWYYNLINVGCELCGYYLAAFLIDHKGYGRRTMQLVGFGMMFVLFATVAIGFPVLNQQGPGAKVFQFIFFFSNFWINFGPNSTTFLIAGEAYPRSVRATLHGFSAAVGKTGALLATVLYNYIEDRTKFILVTICTLVGFGLTFFFVPDTTGLNLSERQRYFQHVVEGREKEYHGTAIHPRHISWYERVVLKRSDLYDSELDRMAKVAELRAEYVAAQKEDDGREASGREEDCLNPNVVKFFELERTVQQ